MTERALQEIDYGSFPSPPEGVPKCIDESQCGYYNTIAATRTMIERYPGRWGGQEATKQATGRLDEAESAIMVAAEGCAGSNNPTSWHECRRLELIQGMLETGRSLLAEQQTDSLPPGQYL